MCVCVCVCACMQRSQVCCDLSEVQLDWNAAGVGVKGHSHSALGPGLGVWPGEVSRRG